MIELGLSQIYRRKYGITKKANCIACYKNSVNKYLME